MVSNFIGHQLMKLTLNKSADVIVKKLNYFFNGMPLETEIVNGETILVFKNGMFGFNPEKDCLKLYIGDGYILAEGWKAYNGNDYFCFEKVDLRNDTSFTDVPLLNLFRSIVELLEDYNSQVECYAIEGVYLPTGSERLYIPDLSEYDNTKFNYTPVIIFNILAVVFVFIPIFSMLFLILSFRYLFSTRSFRKIDFVGKILYIVTILEIILVFGLFFYITYKGM